MAENNVILLENASVAHDEKTILSGVNFRVEQGEFVYLIGEVGSGKSSLLKTLYAELPFREGRGQVLDVDIASVKTKKIPALRRNIGMVFQDFQLLNDRTVAENLMFVLKATGWKKKHEMDDRINQVLTEVNMLEKKYEMPHTLSGGEQQCVSIARANLNNPPLIFADEPTGNLDPASADRIMSLLHDLNKKEKTVVMVTHNYSLLKKFPARTFECKNGTLIEQLNVYDSPIEML
jgi:cell division transport system ATP-binding protein